MPKSLWPSSCPAFFSSSSVCVSLTVDSPSSSFPNYTSHVQRVDSALSLFPRGGVGECDRREPNRAVCGLVGAHRLRTSHSGPGLGRLSDGDILSALLCLPAFACVSGEKAWSLCAAAPLIARQESQRQSAWQTSDLILPSVCSCHHEAVSIVRHVSKSCWPLGSSYHFC